MTKQQKKICCLCEGELDEYGHNAEPIADGRCCDLCNVKVINARRFGLSVVCPDQPSRLAAAEERLQLGPVAVAKLMGVPYDTYKQWKSERRNMSKLAIRCLDLLLDQAQGRP